jgi:hypothetical protein
MCICVISQRNHNFTEQIRRLKKIEDFPSCAKKNFRTLSYAYLHICEFSEEITAVGKFEI